MTATIWLASYPKSGNTWLRILLANLAAKDGEPVSINDLPIYGGIASARGPVDYLSLIDSGLLTHDEIDELRPQIYAELAAGAPEEDDADRRSPPPIRFIKVHDAYSLTPSGRPLLAGRRGAQGAVLILRDPRDVAPSLASHNNISIDEAIAVLNNSRDAAGAKPGRQYPQLRQRLWGWSGHAQSWLDQRDIPLCVIRYEDMKADTITVLRRVLEFSQWQVTEADIARAVAAADFGKLQRQEAITGFVETPRNTAGAFFRRGQVGGWRGELQAEQVARIEAAHAPMMQRLGYPLSNSFISAQPA